MSGRALPEDFRMLMRQQWGADEADHLCEALCDTEPSVSVRLNPAKASCVDGLGERVPWCGEGIYLPSRPAFTYDPWLHAGAYYVQDASSMFLAHIVRQCVSGPVTALDLCAAPGGKSTLLATCLPEGSLLVSNEPLRQRAQVLAENVTKWGRPDVLVTQNYPEDFTSLCRLFDLVVADVPCSGEGMFRKDEQAIADWSMQTVELCQRRQRGIVEAVWPALKEDGLLVYSTCTFNRMENEDNVDWICEHLGAEPVTIATDSSWGILDTHHFLPGRVRGEGQFMSVLRKRSGDSAAQTFMRMSKDKNKNKRKDPSHVAEPKEWRGCVTGDYHYFLHGEAYHAFPSAFSPLLPLLYARLTVLVCGVCLAVRKGRDWQPHHALAMSSVHAASAFPVAAVDYEQALAYLRHEVLQVDAPKGYVLLAYCGLSLGFVKNLGNRANNLYPQEWRVRSSHVTPYTLF